MSDNNVAGVFMVCGICFIIYLKIIGGSNSAADVKVCSLCFQKMPEQVMGR